VIFTKNRAMVGCNDSSRLEYDLCNLTTSTSSAGVAWARFSRVLMHHGKFDLIHAARDKSKENWCVKMKKYNKINKTPSFRLAPNVC
jgi:hypothetical protein